MQNITYSSSKWYGEAAHLRSLSRAFADCNKRRYLNEGSGKIVYTSYVIKVLTGKDQASMHIRTVSLEPSLIAL